MVNVLKFNPAATPSVAILMKTDDVSSSNTTLLYSNYLKKLVEFKVPAVGNSVVFIGLPIANKNLTKAFMTPYIEEILDYCDTHGITTLMVAESKYFGALTGVTKVEDNIGYTFQCKIPGYSHITILPSLHYNILYYNPTKQLVIDRSLKVLADVMLGTYKAPGADDMYNLIKVTTEQDLIVELQKLKEYKVLTCDIETTGLRFETDSILTISFGIDEYSGVGIALHYTYHNQFTEMKMLEYLKNFFEESKGKITFIYHNGLFDVKFIIRRLFMKHGGDFTGMYYGIDVLGDFVDTMIVTYLATNSTDRAVLGLKQLSMERMGDYAVDAKNALTIPLDNLLEYNIKDCCATWYVYNKYWPIMESDDQLDVYNTIFRPSNSGLLEMMMTGLPMNMQNIEKAKSELSKSIEEYSETIRRSEYVLRCNNILRYNAMNKYNDTHKKQKTMEDFSDTVFNPGSSSQLRILLFQIMGFSPIEKTETGEPSTNSASIKAFVAESTNNGDVKAVELLEAILGASAADKVLGTFINAFETFAHKHPSGDTFLNGNLKLGGTASGRLSSNNPNLQNLPSGSIYGKLVKSCFAAPEGWLFFGADFSALEDKIGAILSGDKMKTLEFSKGVDG